MKRTAVTVILAIAMSAGIFAQQLTNPRFTQLPHTPVPITPESTYFVEFDDPSKSSDKEEGVDYVTVGSLMPYKVAPPIAAGDMPQSANTNFRIEYKWLFTPQSPLAATPLGVLKMPAATTELPTPAALTATDAFWYNANEVSVRMPADEGTVTLTNSARYVFNNLPLCPGEDPDDKGYTIKIVPRPSVRLASGVAKEDLEIVSCVETDVVIPTSGLGAHLTVDGFEDINIEFTLTHRAIGSSGTPTTLYQNQWLVLNGKTLDFPGELFQSPGVYSIDITNVTDRISRKSLDRDAVKAKLETDLPAASYSVFIYPKPDTNILQPVKHIKNN